MDASLATLRQQWRDNRRLRIGVLVACLILGLDVALSLADRRDALGDEIARDADLLVRLREAASDTAWPGRAQEAEAALSAMRESIPDAGSEGSARAELQAWLSQLASQAGMAEVQVRVHDVLAVEGHPALRQVLARLGGQLPRAGIPGLLEALESGRPWIQAERLEISMGEPADVVVVVRGYYRVGDDGAAAAAPTDGAP